MATKKSVKIQKDGVTSEVMPSSVKTWERHGWTVVDDGSSETDSNEAAEYTVKQDGLFTMDKE